MRAAKESEKAQQTRYHSARNALEEALRVASQPLSLSLLKQVPLVCNACFGADCVWYLDSGELVAKVQHSFAGSGVSARLPRQHLGDGR